MRLVCPNCDAEYEVDAAVIPVAGRDVQCSNCGHAWFQLSPEREAEMALEADLHDAPPLLAKAVEPVAAKAAVVEPQAFAQPELPPRSIDESVLSVLREEAARETEARKSEAPLVEMQTEMALVDHEQTAVTRRIARMKGVEAAPIKPQTRREMLPEIEEINSTLRASSEKRSGEAAAVADTMLRDKPKGAGFSSGFVLMLLIAAVAVAVYVMAPKLAAQFPAASEMLTTYVSVVERGRVWMDGMLQTAIGFMRGLAGGKA